MIKNIIFDFGGVVLIHKASLIEEILTKMFPDSSNKAIQLYLKHRAFLQTGKESSEDFITVLKQELKNNLNVNELMKIWEEEYKKAAKINKFIINLVKNLNKNYNVYLFTDTIDVHDKYNSKRKIYNNFKRVFKSFVEKINKQDKKAFVNVLNKIGAQAKDCLFIDDLENNVKAARKIGMKGIVFQNATHLKRDLVKFGIKINK